MDTYKFYYDESEHSRKINYNTVTAPNYYDNFVTVIVGWSKEKEKEVYVLFEDHGQGIENIEIEKIFNRSYTLSDTNKNYESSGLGLAISKNLANGMNSDILVKSIPHKQTVFNWKIKK